MTNLSENYLKYLATLEEAVITHARFTGTFYEIQVSCPSCGRTHYHTYYPDPGSISDRRPPCDAEENYRLVDPMGLAPVRDNNAEKEA